MDLKLTSITTSILIIVGLAVALRFLKWAWLRPRKLEKLLREQGLNGKPYRFLIGDIKEMVGDIKAEKKKTLKFSDDIPSHIFPFQHKIINQYGNCSFVWFGASPRINITDPELMREIFSKPSVFQKPPPDPLGEAIVRGLLFLEDEKWATHRKIINTAFHMEKLKMMIPAMFITCLDMIGKWGALISSNGNPVEIDVWPYLQDLSGDVISRTAFGSSHELGSRIFKLQREQVKLVLQLLQFYLIPGWRHIPTKANRRMNAIKREIHSLVKGIVRQRERAEIIDDDLLGILMESNDKEIQEQGNKKMGMSINDVIEECKMFYFAGSETTSNLLLWTMVMLSQYQEWQARAREEVLQVMGSKEPTFDGLNQLKTVTMILNEVLRMYPPAPITSQALIKTVKLGSMIVPVGAELNLLLD